MGEWAYLYYVVSKTKSNGLESLAPYVYLERSGESHGYIEYSPIHTGVDGFKTFEMAFYAAFEIFDTINSYYKADHVKFADGLYIIDQNTKCLSKDLSDIFLNGLESIENPYDYKGEIEIEKI